MIYPFTWRSTEDLEGTSSWQPNLPIYDKEEWRLVCQRVRPNWTDAKFDSVWDAFIEYKRMHCVS